MDMRRRSSGGPSLSTVAESPPPLSIEDWVAAEDALAKLAVEEKEEPMTEKEDE